MAKRTRTTLEPVSDFRNGDLMRDIGNLLEQAIKASTETLSASQITITLKAKVNKRGTAIEVLDKVKLKKPIPGNLMRFEETTLEQRLSTAVAIDEEHQQRIPEADGG